MAPSTAGLEKYLKECNTFDKVLEKVKITVSEKGNCTAELKIDEDHINPLQQLHNGLSATLVDVITSMALLSHEKCAAVPSVSVNLHVMNIKEAMVGEEIVIEAHTPRVGRAMAYLECEIKNKATGEVLVKGSQTKYFMHPKV